MQRLLSMFVLMLAASAVAADKPNIDKVSVDKNERLYVIVHFDQPLPNVAGINQALFWEAILELKAGPRRRSVVAVDLSRFNESEAKKAGVDTSLVENSIRLQLSDEIPAEDCKVNVILLNKTTFLTASGAVSAIGGGHQKPLSPAKNRDDADIYFKGSHTTVYGDDPQWNIDAFAGYMKGVHTANRYYGKIGVYGQVQTKKSKKADPDSFLAYAVYQRVLGQTGGWLGPFQTPYLNGRLWGAEFDRKSSQRNWVTSPVVTFPFRLSHKLAGALQPGVTFPHMTVQLGTEFVDVADSILPAGKGWHVRGLVGATFSAGYAPESPLFHSIQFTSSWQVRFPSAPEIFYDNRFAPVNATGKKGDPPPMLGTQARHNLDNKFSYMFVKWLGVTIEHTYGSAPPTFNKTDHTLEVGLAFTLKQTSYGRYSILKP